MKIEIDITKTIQYRYIQHRFKKWCLKNETLESLSQKDKDKICIEATKKTRSFTFIYIPFYIVVILIFHFGFIMNPKYSNNDFVIWYRGIIESVIPLINENWGSSWNKKQGTFLIVYIKLFPVIITIGLPLFIPILIMANKFLIQTIEQIVSKVELKRKKK